MCDGFVMNSTPEMSHTCKNIVVGPQLLKANFEG
jgi:hypothetical protein